METTNIVDFARRDGMTDALTDLLRTGAQELIATAVEAEFASYLAQFADLRTDAGHAAVVRNGHHPARPFQTGIGPVSVRIRRRCACKKIGPSSWHSSTSQLNIGRASAPVIQLNLPSPRSATVPNARRAACRAMACCT